MPSFDDVRKQYPGWKDNDIIAAIAKDNGVDAGYVRGYLGFAEPESEGVAKSAYNVGVDAVQGVGQAAQGLVGLAGLVPGVNYAADPLGRGISQATKWVGDTLHTQSWLDEEAQMRQAIQAASADGGLDGNWAGAKEAVSQLAAHPRQAVGAAAGSIPQIFGGGYLAKGAQVAARGLGMTRLAAGLAEGTTAAAVGEGAMGAGSMAGQIAEDPNNSFTSRYYAVPAGVVTGAIGKGVNKLMGAGDLEVQIAKRIMGGEVTNVERAAVSKAPINLLTAVPKSVLQEGVLEEGLQSPNEQMFQNIAEGKPWSQGLGSSAVEGIAAGGLFGLGGGYGSIRGEQQRRGVRDTLQAQGYVQDGAAPVDLLSGLEARDFDNWVQPARDDATRINGLVSDPYSADGIQMGDGETQAGIAERLNLGKAAEKATSRRSAESLAAYNAPSGVFVPDPETQVERELTVGELAMLQANDPALDLKNPTKGTPDVTPTAKTQQAKTQGQEQQPAAPVGPKLPANAAAGLQGSLLGNSVRYDRSRETGEVETPAAVDYSTQSTLDFSVAPTPADLAEIADTAPAGDPKADLNAASLARLAAAPVVKATPTPKAIVTPGGKIAADDIEDQTHAEGVRMFEVGESFRNIAEALGGSHQGWSNTLRGYGYKNSDRVAAADATALDTEASAVTHDTPVAAEDDGVTNHASVETNEHDDVVDREAENGGLTVSTRKNSGAATAATTDTQAAKEVARAVKSFSPDLTAHVAAQVETLGQKFSTMADQQKLMLLQTAKEGGRDLTQADVSEAMKLKDALKTTVVENKLTAQRKAEKENAKLAEDAAAAHDLAEKLLSGDTAAYVPMLEVLGGANGFLVRQSMRTKFGMPNSMNTSKAIADYFVGAHAAEQAAHAAEAEIAAVEGKDIWDSTKGSTPWDSLSVADQRDFYNAAKAMADNPRMLEHLKGEFDGRPGSVREERANSTGTVSDSVEGASPSSVGGVRVAATGDSTGGEATESAPRVTVKKKRTLDRGVVRSQGGLVSPEKQLSEASVVHVVEKLLAQFSHKPPVLVRNSEAEVLEVSPAGSDTAAGMVFDGKIHLFRDGLSDTAHVVRTLWHEMLHYGLRRFLTKSQYISKLTDLYDRDAWVKDFADGWVATDEGNAVSSENGPAYARARGVDEALATLAERGKGEFGDTGLVAKTYRTVSRWVAALANMFGFHQAASQWRALNHDEARDLIRTTFGNLEQDAEATNDDPAFFSDPAFSRTVQVAAALAGKSGALIAEDATHQIKKMAYSLASLADLVDEFKGEIPAIKTWYDGVQASVTSRKKYEGDAESIAAAATKLKNGTDKVNAFISQSTYDQKWGYDPKFANRAVVVDPMTAVAFSKLSAEEQAVVKSVFAHGEKMAELKQNILNALGISKEFSSGAKLEGPYSPLKRFGNYLAQLKSKELRDAEVAGDTKLVSKLKSNPDHYVMSAFDTKGQAVQFADANKSKWFFTDSFEKSTRIEDQRSMPGPALSKVLAAVKVSDKMPVGAKAAMTQLVQDMYFHALDENNARLSGAKRLNRAGYDADMLRSFLSHARAQAGFMANMEHGGEINDAFYKMQAGAKDDTSGKHSHQDAFNTIAAHYAENLKYNETPWQDRAMALTSAMQLATSVGYHLNNAMQPVMVTVPQLAADFNNYSGAWKHMLAGYKTVAKTGMWGSLDLTKVKDPGLRAALQVVSDKGLLELGMLEDMGNFEATHSGIASVDKVSSVARSALHKLRQISQSFENLNRVASAAAAYNMAIEARKTVAEAQEYAVHIVRATQGDTSRINKPLLLKRLPKIMGQYKGYQFMMGALYVKAFRQAFLNADPIEKKIGQRMLAFKLFHTSMAAGVLGMPMMNLVGLVFSGMGGDDEPEDLERYLRESGIPQWMLHGPLSYFGLDMSAKLGDDKIFSVLPYGNWDVSSASGVAKTAMSLTGPAASQVGKMADGLGLFQQGAYYKGLEKFMPSGVANGMKAFRIANEGFSLKNGDVMFKPEDVNGFALALDALGMPSSEMKKMEWLRSQQYEIGRFYVDHTKQIEQDYNRAYKEHDAEKMTELRQDWMDLQAGKDHMRQYFGNSNAELKRQPITNLLKYPATSVKREKKLQAASKTE